MTQKTSQRKRSGFAPGSECVRNFVPEMEGFRNLTRAEFGEDMQKSPAQIGLLLYFVLLVLPARRECVRKNSAKALLVPVAVLKRSHTIRQPLNPHGKQELARFCGQEMSKPSCRRGVLQPLL